MTEEVEGSTSPEGVISSEPVEQAEPVETDTTQQEPVAEQTDEQKNEQVQREAAAKAERKARGVQKRIDELTADKHAERKRADELAAMNARIMAMIESQRPQAQRTDGLPQRENFADDVSFVEARAAYVAEQKAMQLFQQAQAQQTERFQQMQREAAQKAAAQAFVERQKAYEKSIPDFRETLEDADIEMPNETLAAIRQMDDGPLVAYHLAKNPVAAAELANLSPLMQVLRLGQISATLKASPQVSKAPPPGKPVQTKQGSSNEPPSDPDAYQAWAAKHMR